MFTWNACEVVRIIIFIILNSLESSKFQLFGKNSQESKATIRKNQKQQFQFWPHYTNDHTIQTTTLVWNATGFLDIRTAILRILRNINWNAWQQNIWTNHVQAWHVRTFGVRMPNSIRLPASISTCGLRFPLYRFVSFYSCDIEVWVVLKYFIFELFYI